MNLNRKTLLITGIGGFIGSRAAELAIQKGLQVRGLECDPHKAARAKALGAEVATGSTTDVDQVRQACSGVDWVLHTAALVSDVGQAEAFYRANVEGTVTVAEVARASGVRGMVHLSSVMVYGFHLPPQATEEIALTQDQHPYNRTKVEAEKHLAPFLQDSTQFGVIVLRPGNVYGPNSFLWIVRPLNWMRRGLFLLPDGGTGIMDHLYIDNLIDAIFLAMEQEAYGQIFNVSDGGNTTWAEFYKQLAEIADFSAPRSLPAGVLKALISLINKGHRMVSSKPEALVPASIDFLNRPHACSIAKIRAQLGYEPRVSLEEGMKRTKAWLHSSGLVH